GTRVNTPQSEASGRRFTTLPPGATLDVISPIAADSIVLRVAVPDAPQGGGVDGTLEARVGDAVHLLPISSRCALVYGRGRFNSPDVWPEDPAQGEPRRFWCEAAMRLPSFPAGARVTLRNPDPTRTVLVDFAEFELLPPAVPVPESASVFAPPADGSDCTAALQQAIDAAAGQRRALYLAEGDYRVGMLRVPGLRVQGAGMWRTRLLGPLSRLHFTGGTAQVADLAILGETARRNDHSDVDNAISGVPGPGSRLERLWIERKKCAYWHSPDHGRAAEDLLIRGWRIRDTSADGINLYNGARRCVIEECLVRNTGDDGLAVWSPAGRGAPSGDIAIRRNLVELPWFASAIALYGGGPFQVEDNRIADTVTTGSGIYISASFKAHPFAGDVRVAGNVLQSCGAHESGPGGPTGAIRLLALDEDMTAASFTIAGNRVIAPLESALSLHGPRRIANVAVTGLVVEEIGGAVVADVRPGAQGEALIVDAVAPAQAPWRVADDAAMTLLRRSGADTVRVLPSPPRIDRVIPAGDPATRAPDWTLHSGDAIVDLRAPDAAGVPQRWTGMADLSARIWLSRDADSLRIRAVVQDDVQHQDGDAEGAWRGDGVQIALTVPGRPGRLEFGTALHDDGRVLRSLWAVPEGSTFAAVAIVATVQRLGTDTYYEVSVPRAPLGLDDAVLDRGFRFNMIVNDNDGSLRKSFARIAPGIGESKNPAAFPVIRME
ncbi:MAG: right-handed parallel beta-helix repeat-containing protein, partial [Planctomycetes bacterium]|nr:right-handed parallel beta-helix repeat-containing protein [Planctomycetota bacterium]